MRIFVIIAAFVISACTLGSDTVDPETSAVSSDEIVLERVESEDATFQVVRVLDDLEHPWGVTWLPDDRMLITERPGRLNLVDGEQVTSLSGLPEIQAQGQGGLLDVALHPGYEENGWIYFTYSTPGDGGTGTALARARLDGEALTDLEVLYEQEPKYRPGRHYGSRIVFPYDGTVAFTIGDRGQRDPSQDTQDPSGTTLLLNDDGSIPDDNPFVNDEDVLDEIYTYGHRNAQGMDLHPETGVIWQHEHGPYGGDELNVIEAGENYGWPEATYGTEYSDPSQPVGTDPDRIEEFKNPVLHWTEPHSIAPSGMAFYTGDALPGWTGDIFVGALAEQHIHRVVLDGDEVSRQEELLRDEIGRIRDVRVGPDGHLHVLTDHSNGGLYRLEPVDE